MSDKEDDSFAMSILCVGIAVYIAVCAMAFAGLVATRESTAQAFLDYTKDYGGLIAGIPVLIAVLVAKQQLDAGRRQHVANIKRSFQPELDALDEVDLFAKIAIDSDLETARRRAEADGIDGIIIDRPAGSELRKYREILPFDIADIVVSISKEISGLFEESIREKPDKQILALRISEIQTKADTLSAYIQHRRNHLSQYWS